MANRGPEAAPLHLLPTLWFRNTWSWGVHGRRPSTKPLTRTRRWTHAIVADHATLGEYRLHTAKACPKLLFTENETQHRATVTACRTRRPYVKDAFHEYVVHGERDAVNPHGHGTKAARCITNCASGGGAVQRCCACVLTLDDRTAGMRQPFGPGFDAVFAQRMPEADEFYATLIPADAFATTASVSCGRRMRACCGRKQFYHYVVDELAEWRSRPAAAAAGTRAMAAITTGRICTTDDVISMPDKWEYPWYAAWDLAFHMIPLAQVDPDFAKEQLVLLLREWYMHPNGQIPAYEWAFGDVNPPVHAWACWRVYKIDRRAAATRDRVFLERAFTSC